MAEMREFSPELFDWLNNHGDVDKWAVSKFPYKRWDNITTNIAESFNAWMVKERKHNVAQMIHEHREKVAKKMQASSVAMTKWKSCIGPKIETKVKENVEVSKQFITTDYGRGNVNVQTSRGHHRVSLSLHHCSCAEWQMTGIPCRHACAAVKTVHGDIYDYIEGWYKFSCQQKIYGRCMIPVVTIDMPNLNDYRMENISNQILLQPPITSRAPGRPKITRHESQYQDKKIYRCTQCHQVGHTRRTCKNPNPS
ncbi:uncharacterized protein LOC114735576 [Neltuma alba]|uniref:uncharacterized protein LOC114735576 n=1 Tax=Neltuma alba TaxID=207710 RepID=UPI0010A30919|nr:uncharacterized protein LOC114735576 [Prosopis alba]